VQLGSCKVVKLVPTVKQLRHETDHYCRGSERVQLCLHSPKGTGTNILCKSSNSRI